jgi:hypothetical protein
VLCQKTTLIQHNKLTPGTDFAACLGVNLPWVNPLSKYPPGQPPMQQNLKKNTVFAYKQNRHNPILELQVAMENVLEHHFGRHDKCGPWCQTKKWTGNQEMLDKMYYRYKDKDMATYLQLRDI